MTPAQVEEYSRRRYNAVSDTFFGSDEILQYIYDACMDLARETQCIERSYASPTEENTQSYDFPTNALAVKRVTFNGYKLTPIDMRDDDAITGMNMSTADTGNPRYYWIWESAIYLRPIPGSVGTLKIWTINFPSSISATSTLEVPTQFHIKLCDYVNQQMAVKDQNFTAATYYGTLWEKDKADIKSWIRRSKRTDGFASVKDENMIVETYIA